MGESTKTHFVMGLDAYINALVIPKLARKLSMGSPQTTVEMKLVSEEALDDLALGKIDILCSESKTKQKKPCLNTLLYKDRYICVARKENSLDYRDMTENEISKQHIVVAPMRNKHLNQIKSSLNKANRNPNPVSIVSYHEIEEGHRPKTEGLLIISELLFRKSPYLESYIKINGPWQLPAFSYDLFWHQKHEENPCFMYLKKSLLDMMKMEE
tara:strand:- start:115 stop:753 length:639 start_codon:yes stop_codon:yes gene_type:complete